VFPLLNNIKAVLFDFDDTLVNVHDAVNAATYMIATMFSNKFNLSIFPIIDTLRGIHREMVQRGILNRNEWWYRLFSLYGINVDLDFMDLLTKKYWDIIIRYTYVDPETITILNYLRSCNYKLGIISNTDGHPGMKMRRIRNALPTELFSVIIIAGEDTMELKPSPEPFDLALKKLGLNGYESMYIGDDPNHDIAGAKAVNMITAILKSTPNNKDYGGLKPDIEIRSLRELLKLLRCYY
jgi:HAD superfamily hydrolase (TIGR01549 family)